MNAPHFSFKSFNNFTTFYMMYNTLKKIMWQDKSLCILKKVLSKNIQYIWIEIVSQA